MINDDNILKIYEDVLQELSTSPIIYVEGKTIDKMFYSRLNLFKNANLISSGSCTNVRKFVELNQTSLGVLDRDYDDFIDSKRIFKTRFYSIENIALINDDRYSALRRIIKDKLGIVILNDKRYRICESKTYFDNIIKNNKFDFYITKKYYDKQYFKYIKKRIFTKNRFLRLKNLKKTIKNYRKFYSDLNNIKQKNWYDGELAKQVDERTIFYKKDYRKLSKLV